MSAAGEQPFFLNGVRILLVEDNEINQLLARTILEDWGCHVGIANNGEESIDILSRKKESYDIVLMDMQMPIMGGVQATKVLRQELHFAFPIIALTANASKEDERTCLEAGMNDYISKPFKEEELYRKISRWLTEDLGASKNASVVVEKLAENNEWTGPLYSVEKLTTLSRGNHEFVKKMVALFIETTPVQVQKLKQALASQDLQALKNVAHTMKPSLDMLGVDSLYDTIRGIEESAAKQKDIETLPDQVQRVATVLDKVVQSLKASL